MKVVIITALLLLAVPSAVGSAAGAVALAPHQAPAAALFPGVPSGGFPNAFPFGQCTWWAAYNRSVSWSGNAGDWLANARAQGFATADTPTVGAIAVYRPGGDYSRYGHVAIVVGVSPSGYTVSEMNAVGWGLVSTRRLAWPDPQVAGFIPLAAADQR
ncbi:MAG TPA: CHAP domain-containing protein [Candidatus Limnocylindria bacterium]|nr:CHAP domain-containing protein [Candidatus Limnocylindria bacterium]